MLKNNKKGFTTLITVLILGLASTTIVTSLLLLSIDANKDNVSLVRQSKSRAITNACAEQALNKLKQSVSYLGNESLVLLNGKCTIFTISGSGNTTREVKVDGEFEGTITRATISISQVSPQVLITSWIEGR